MAVNPHFAAQDAKKTCENHTDMDINMYCYECMKKLCTKCIKQDHRLHEWETLDVVIRQKSEQAPVLCKGIREQKIPQLQSFIQELKSAKLQVAQQQKNSIDEVKSCKDSLVSAVEKIADEKIHILVNEGREKNEEIDKGVSTLERNIEQITEFVDTFEINARSKTSFGITDLEQAIQTTVNQIKKPDIQSLTKWHSCVKGEITPKILKAVFDCMKSSDGRGETDSIVPTKSDNYPDITVKEYASFSYGDTRILTISPISESEAWLHKSQSTGSDLLTVQGNGSQHREMGCKFPYFITLNNGDIVYTDFLNCVIYRIDITHKVTKIMDTAPLFPQGVCLSLSGDLFVTLMDDKSCTTNTDSQRLVLQITMSGDFKRKYQYDKDTNEQLFTSPYRVQQNFNGDICVADRINSDTRLLCIMKEDGSVKCRYSGNSLQKPFSPTDIACDFNCNILLSDLNNHTVHLLKHSGDLLRYLLTDKEGLQHPTALGLGRDNLWVGDTTGKIKVFSYIY